MPDTLGLPSFKYEELLSHTFPGFFAAISIFMLIDIISPMDLTAWVAKDLASLVTSGRVCHLLNWYSESQ